MINRKQIVNKKEFITKTVKYEKPSTVPISNVVYAQLYIGLALLSHHLSLSVVK